MQVQRYVTNLGTLLYPGGESENILNAYEEYSGSTNFEEDLCKIRQLIDIGAHVGTFSLGCFQRREQEPDLNYQIEAYEAIWNNAILASINLRNTDVILYNSAVFDVDGEITFEIGSSSTTSRASIVEPYKHSNGYKKPLSSVIRYSSIPSIKATSILNNAQLDTTLLKLDIEGSEYRVILDLIKDKCLPGYLLVELHPTISWQPIELVEVLNLFYNIKNKVNYCNGCMIVYCTRKNLK